MISQPPERAVTQRTLSMGARVRLIQRDKREGVRVCGSYNATRERGVCSRVLMFLLIPLEGQMPEVSGDQYLRISGVQHFVSDEDAKQYDEGDYPLEVREEDGPLHLAASAHEARRFKFWSHAEELGACSTSSWVHATGEVRTGYERPPIRQLVMRAWRARPFCFSLLFVLALVSAVIVVNSFYTMGGSQEAAWELATTFKNATWTRRVALANRILTPTCPKCETDDCSTINITELVKLKAGFTVATADLDACMSAWENDKDKFALCDDERRKFQFVAEQHHEDQKTMDAHAVELIGNTGYHSNLVPKDIFSAVEYIAIRLQNTMDKLWTDNDALRENIQDFNGYVTSMRVYITCLEMSGPSIPNCLFWWTRKECVMPELDFKLGTRARNKDNVRSS